MNIDVVGASPALESFEIPLANMPKLAERIERLNKRARKLGIREICVGLGETFQRVFEDDRYPGGKRAVSFQRVTVAGETPRVNGWEFLATLQHLGEDGNIIRAIPGEKLAIEYRSAKPICQHCNVDRRRNDTYVLREIATGALKQIGRNCLAISWRTTTPEQIASWLEICSTRWTQCATWRTSATARAAAEMSTSSSYDHVCATCAATAFYQQDQSAPGRSQQRAHRLVDGGTGAARDVRPRPLADRSGAHPARRRLAAGANADREGARQRPRDARARPDQRRSLQRQRRHRARRSEHRSSQSPAASSRSGSASRNGPLTLDADASRHVGASASASRSCQ